MIKKGMRPASRGNSAGGVHEAVRPSPECQHAGQGPRSTDKSDDGHYQGQRGSTGDTAVRLATFFDTTAEFWMNLRKPYELRLAEQALPVKVWRHIEQRRGALVTA